MPVLAGQAGPASQISGASAGGLQPLNFRRPTKVGGLDGLMEDGYIGGNWEHMPHSRFFLMVVGILMASAIPLSFMIPQIKRTLRRAESATVAA